MRVAGMALLLAAFAPARPQADLEREYKAVGDREVVDYVNGIAKRLTSAPAEVRVLDTAESRAGAFPRSYVYVSTGLIERAATEAELAAVIAHDLAHAAAPEALRTTGRVNGVGNPLIVDVQFPFGLCARFQPERTLAPIGLKPLIEESEKGADQRARDSLAKAGYDPSLVATAFASLRRPSLRSRPLAPGRLGEIQARLK
jgi:predicted Zn-dependent protease